MHLALSNDIFFCHNVVELWAVRDWAWSVGTGGITRFIRGVNTSRIPDASHSLYGLLSPPRLRPLTPCDTSAMTMAHAGQSEKNTASGSASIPRRENYFS